MGKKCIGSIKDDISTEELRRYGNIVSGENHVGKEIMEVEVCGGKDKKINEKSLTKNAPEKKVKQSKMKINWSNEQISVNLVN